MNNYKIHGGRPEGVRDVTSSTILTSRQLFGSKDILFILFLVILEVFGNTTSLIFYRDGPDIHYFIRNRK